FEGGQLFAERAGGSLAMKTQKEREQAFVEDVKKTLQDKGEKLDPEILVKLTAMRSGVVENHGYRYAWLWKMARVPAAAFMVGAMGFALVIFASRPPATIQQSLLGLEDVEILASVESPDFFAELEFYNWLAEQRDV
ncbi:MAG: hypothetical protein ABFQ82_00360, partial [Thermodesulfobacteriota bacterium]